MEQLMLNMPETSTCSPVERPVRTCRSQASGAGCRKVAVRDLLSPSHLSDFVTSSGLNGFCGRTYPVCFLPTAELTFGCSSGRLGNSGILSPTGLLTFSSPEWTSSPAQSPSGDAVCGLSDILERTGPRLARYFLSQRACEGILRRAAARGKDLPEPLALALKEQIAAWDSGELKEASLER